MMNSPSFLLSFPLRDLHIYSMITVVNHFKANNAS